MQDEPQYQPIVWHTNHETPKSGSQVTWIGTAAIGGPQIDGRYMDGGLWIPEKGRPVTGADKIVQWRYRK